VNSLSERGINRQGEGITRRRLLGGFAVTALAALAGGCAEVDLPQGTGRDRDGRPQTVSEPQIDEEAAREVSVAYLIALGAGLFFLRRIR